MASLHKSDKEILSEVLMINN